MGGYIAAASLDRNSFCVFFVAADKRMAQGIRIVTVNRPEAQDENSVVDALDDVVNFPKLLTSSQLGTLQLRLSVILLIKFKASCSLSS